MEIRGVCVVVVTFYDINMFIFGHNVLDMAKTSCLRDNIKHIPILKLWFLHEIKEHAHCKQAYLLQ